MRSGAWLTAVALGMAVCVGGGSARGYYIETMGGGLFHAMVSGDWVAWAEITQGAMSSIYTHNVVSGETQIVVADDPTTPNVLEATANIWSWAWWHPQFGISGATVVFADRRSGPINLRTKNFETGVETVVSSSNDCGFPAIDGNRVVWQYGGAYATAYAATLTGANRKTLGSGDFPLPDVDGDIAVWKVGNAVGSTIKYRNLVSGQTGTVFQADQNEDLRSVVIDGNIVAWTMRDEDAVLGTVVRIMAYDMSTGTLTTVKDDTGSTEHRSMVSVSNGIVVWEDWRNSGLQRDIYGYDLSKGEEFAIDTSPADERGPCIDGDIVTWSEGDVGGQIGWVRLSEVLSPLLLGDVNLDGAVNALDIGAFVQRLTDGAFQAEADVNEDGAVDALDVSGFISCITGGACGGGGGGSAVPEPGTAGVMVVGAMAMLRRRG